MKKTLVNIGLPVAILREGKRYIAYTPALDVSTSGKSHDEVRKRFAELVEIFFEETLRKGTLDIALKELGWQKTKSSWKPPVVVA
jgi:hypothetical protein